MATSQIYISHLETHCVYLGVTIDNELKFHQHIALKQSRNMPTEKASRMLGLVKATFTCLDGITVPRLFTAMVRPHLEYGNVIWSPRYRSDCLELEKIQRRPQSNQASPQPQITTIRRTHPETQTSFTNAQKTTRGHDAGLQNNEWH